MQLKMINDRILVERIYDTNKTQSGIIIPETAKEMPVKGRVVFVGDGGYVDGHYRETQLKVGDEVLFGKYAGSEIKVNGQDYLIMMEIDIYGILNSDHPVAESEQHASV